MSGTTGLYPSPIRLDMLPPDSEGPKQAALTVSWAPLVASGSYSQAINLLSQFNTGQFTTFQSVIVDNSTCPNMVMLTALESGQRVMIPPFTNGWYPLLTSQAPTLTAQMMPAERLFGGNPVINQCSTTFYFMNVPARFFERAMPRNGFGYQSLSFGFAYPTALVPITIIPSWNQPSAFPGLQFPTSGRWMLSMFRVQLWNNAAGYAVFSGAPLVAIYLMDGLNARQVWEGVFQGPTTGPALVYDSGTVAFDPPVIQVNQTLPLSLVLGTAPNSGALNGTITVAYGAAIVA